MHAFSKEYNLYQTLDTHKIYCVHKLYGLKSFGMDMGKAHHVVINFNIPGSRVYIHANDRTFSMIERDKKFESTLGILDSVPKLGLDDLLNARIVNETGRYLQDHTLDNTQGFLRCTDGEIRNFVIRELGNHANSNTSNVPT